MNENIFFIGTSHISPESVKSVKSFIESEKPDIVALELDNKRLPALLENKKRSGFSFSDIKRIGFKGWLFSVFGSWIQKKLGKKIGISPGSEMLAAYKLAVKNKIQIALVDQDIEKTLRNFSKSITWKEKWRFFVDLIKGFFSRKKIKIDLKKVPEEKIIEMMISELKNRYPNVYIELIEKRNKVLAKNISKLAVRFPDKKILAVIGAGHLKEVNFLVKKYLKECDFV
jgi:pheromone shutdown-related protein TraB